jgi:hypothetical protein
MRIEMENHQTRKRTVIDIRHKLVDLSRYRKKDGTRRENLSSGQFTSRAIAR